MTVTDDLLIVLTGSHAGFGVVIWRARGWLEGVKQAVKMTGELKADVEALRTQTSQQHTSNQARLAAIEQRLATGNRRF